MKKVVISDSELVRMYQNGNLDAFKILLNTYKSKVYSSIYFIVKDKATAEDIMQETFIKALDNINQGKYQDEGKFAPWILRIAHNMCIDYIRKNKRYPQVNIDECYAINSISHSFESVEAVTISSEHTDELKQIIERLPLEQKEVVLLRYYGDMSFQEIAEATGVSINTALGRMRYALINLRKFYKKSVIAYDENFYKNHRI